MLWWLRARSPVFSVFRQHAYGFERVGDFDQEEPALERRALEEARGYRAWVTNNNADKSIPDHRRTGIRIVYRTDPAWYRKRGRST